MPPGGVFGALGTEKVRGESGGTMPKWPENGNGERKKKKKGKGLRLIIGKKRENRLVRSLERSQKERGTKREKAFRQVGNKSSMPKGGCW